ncbi:MAG TPA: amino acid dehydrogenase [Ktedonobacterales bacterium]
MSSAPIDPLLFQREHGHERLVVFSDAATGLRGAIALHNTTLGPAIGGTRLRAYASPAEGILDVLRLSEAMTFKAAVAGLPHGGGKAVIFADGMEEDAAIREARLRAYGRIIDELGGRYITAEDVNTTMADMQIIRRVTPHVAGLPLGAGGGGDPSPVTSVGVLAGMRALAEDVLGTQSLSGVSVALQGLGKVGLPLAELLVEQGAQVTASDVRPEVSAHAQERLGIDLVAPEAIYDVPAAIFAPCAFGGAINDETLPRLRCQIIAGSANNQLQDERHGEALHERGIVYGVDYVINAGGLINVAAEVAPGGYDEGRARKQAEGIYDTIKRLLVLSREQGISTERAAHQLALSAIGKRKPRRARSVSAASQ